MAVSAKALPHNLEAEQSLLGAMIISQPAKAEVLHELSELDFYKDAHRTIFKAIYELNDQEQFDAIMLADRLRDQGKLQSVGGTEYITELVNKGLRPYLAGEYAAIVKEKATRRKLIHAAEAIIKESFQQESHRPPMQFAEDMIFGILEHRNRSGIERASDIYDEYKQDVNYHKEHPDEMRGLKTGYYDLDYKTNGLQRGDLVLIAGRPSMGKSALAMNIGMNAAIDDNKNVCIFSLEMSKKSVLTRMISAKTQIPLKTLLSMDLTANEEAKVELVRNKHFLRSNLYIDDTSGLTIAELRNKMRQFRNEISTSENNAIDLVIIDYLQLMDGGGGENRQVEIATISRNLKALAREFNCPIIAASQLSRGPEARGDKRPMLSDLRESGAIEQDADLVMLIYRDEYYNKNSSDLKGIGEIIIAKQRQGETGTVQLAWIGHLTTFDNLAKNLPGSPDN